MADFELGAKARTAGYRLAGFDRIGSTNGEALAAASAGDPGGLWLAALEQSAGRGRRGRAWASPPGNLAATLLLVPDTHPTMAATLGFVAGVALGRALSDVLGRAPPRIGIDGADGRTGGRDARIALKWPNDVMADGAKLAGILLEARRLPGGRHAIAIGFGVNVVAAPEGLPYPATSLSGLGGGASAEAVFTALADAWVEVFGIWRDGAGLGDVLALWRDMAAGIGAPVAVDRGGDVVRGIFETIDEDGRLIVRAAGESRIAITAGDVHFGVTATAPPD